MEIKGKVHCFFEQSGTFKREFIKLGIPAEDYDIQDNFGETDHKIDLFAEIDNAYEGGASVFDSIGYDDLIVAFYPCIFFSCLSQMAMRMDNKNYRKLSDANKVKEIIKRSQNRQEFYERLLRFIAVCLEKGIRMIFENPWALDTYLKTNMIKKPDVIDENRMLRGDYMVKPTGFWFWNCKPTIGLYTEQCDKEKRMVMWMRKAPIAGLCSEERSMISPDYARNFICDFILGKEQVGTQLSIF